MPATQKPFCLHIFFWSYLAATAVFAAATIHLGQTSGEWGAIGVAVHETPIGCLSLMVLGVLTIAILRWKFRIPLPPALAVCIALPLVAVATILFALF
jgi:hypothetical protein